MTGQTYAPFPKKKKTNIRIIVNNGRNYQHQSSLDKYLVKSNAMGKPVP